MAGHHRDDWLGNRYASVVIGLVVRSAPKLRSKRNRLLRYTMFNTRDAQAQISEITAFYSEHTLGIATNPQCTNPYPGQHGCGRGRHIQSTEVEFINSVWPQAGNDQRLASQIGQRRFTGADRRTNRAEQHHRAPLKSGALKV